MLITQVTIFLQTLADLQRLKRDTESSKSIALDSRSVAIPIRRRGLWITVAAVTLVAVLAVGGYFFFRRPSTKLTDKDTLLLTDFVNTTRDPAFDHTLKQALSVQLEQSPFLNILPDQGVITTLKLMGHPAHEPLTPEIGNEVCLRSNSKALVAGSISAVGSHYLIVIKAVNCQTGNTLSSGQAEADSREQILTVIQRLGNQLREALGESGVSVDKFNHPLEQATTSSLEALRAYTDARIALIEGGDSEALPHFRRAVELDQNFARAYADLGILYQNLGETSGGIEALQKAFYLRSRVSERERLFIEAFFYNYATGELEKANQSYAELLRIYPRDFFVHNMSGINFSILGEYPRAAADGRKSISLTPSVYGYSNLMNYCIALGLHEEAQAAFKQALEHQMDYAFLRLARYELAFIQDDNAGMQEQLEWAIGKPGAEDLAIEVLQVVPYELGQPFPFEYLGPMYPIYVRGQAYLGTRDGQAAATEFKKILEHREIIVNYPLGALSHLQLGRAYSISGNADEAKRAYDDFFTLWKDADPDIPILKEARAEYAKLQ